MWIIILLLVVLCLGLLFLYLQVKWELFSFYRQLKYTKEEEGTFTLFTNFSDKTIARIIEEINQIKAKMQREKDTHLHNEREVRNMIANISHDIRTPLTSIQGYLEMSEHSDDVAERTRYASIIQNRLADLEAMLDEFFLYTKLKSMREEIILEEQELYPLLCSCLLNYRDLLQEHDLAPEIHCVDEGVRAKIHEESFRRICTNLIMNTIRYGVQPFVVELTQGEDTITISFSNHVRESKVDVEHIFDRFYKGSEARTQKGSGLGLAIVKELSHQMRGDVVATFRDGLLTITFTLPT